MVLTTNWRPKRVVSIVNKKNSLVIKFVLTEWASIFCPLHILSSVYRRFISVLYPILLPYWAMNEDVTSPHFLFACVWTSPYWKWVPGTFSGGQGGRFVWLTISPPSCAECHEIWEPKPPGTLWATPGLLRDCFTYTFYMGELMRYSVSSPLGTIRLQHSCWQYAEVFEFVASLIRSTAVVMLIAFFHIHYFLFVNN